MVVHKNARKIYILRMISNRICKAFGHRQAVNPTSEINLKKYLRGIKRWYLLRKSRLLLTQNISKRFDIEAGQQANKFKKNSTRY